MKHRATKKSHAALYTKSSTKSSEVKEVLISSSSSVLDLFPDGDQKCLTCIKTFKTNEELLRHEQEKEHKCKLVTMELRDSEDLKRIETQKTVIYCDICEEASSQSAVQHVKSYEHL